MFNPDLHPHRRRNALTGEWILVSPHRSRRPWLGKQESPALAQRPAYDPQCYLCPGNERAGGEVNPAYSGVYVFKNDFAAMLDDTPMAETKDTPFFQAQSVRGTCRVICFSPRHDLTLPLMPEAEIRQVIQVWAEQAKELGKTWRWVQIFENKGAVMGCSNPHPHGQIWAGSALPNEAEKEERAQMAYYREYQRALLLDYLDQELEQAVRIVEQNADWVVLVPYWALWPFELLLLPRRPVRQLYDLIDSERVSLASILKRLLTRYDNLFQTSFPYSMGWHAAPHGLAGADQGAYWQLHAHFYPPLLRSATVKKFMVGYEMLGEPQRDITAEQAAERLRALSVQHYLSQ